jgi:hypothetical protein
MNLHKKRVFHVLNLHKIWVPLVPILGPGKARTCAGSRKQMEVQP